MKSHLGSFDGNHTDGFDSTGGYTAMTNLSKSYPNIHPGYFYIYSLGICWELVPLSTTVFSGLQWHGGSPPLYREGYNPPVDAACLNLVAYPSFGVFEGDALAAFAALPGERHNLFSVRPEMTRARYAILSAIVVLSNNV
jgi:hypothetical protein